MKKIFTILSCLTTTGLMAQISFTELGRYTDGNEAACEISAYDATTEQVFVTNAFNNKLDIIDVSTPSTPILVTAVDITPYGGGINSVVNLKNGYVAVAIEANVKQDSGSVVFFTTAGVYANEVKAGALPDMLALTNSGNKILVANEGEPDDSYIVDPNGSVSVVDISGGVMGLTQNNVSHIEFTAVPSTISGSLHKPSTTWQQDLEPEYITVNDNDTRAFVACQENNILIIIDLTNNTVLSYKGLGFKDHSLVGNGMDASNDDGMINITNHPVKGVYQPDAIASYTANSNTYILTANEGDGRDYTGYSSEERISDLTLDPTAFPNASLLQEDTVLGRLKTFSADMIGDTDNDGDVDELYSYGARSFSIWDDAGNLVWDSGDEIEQYIKNNHPTYFNCNDGKASKQDSRSDDKGPEPESVTVGYVGGVPYAFVGLERQGGIMIYDISTPNNPTFVDYIHTLDTSGIMTDIAPEGLVFIPSTESHTGNNLLVVSNEVSGTVTIYQIDNATTMVNENSLENNIVVYPNPAQDYVNIDLNFIGRVSVRLINHLGQQLQYFKTNDSSLQLSVNNIPAGIYHLVIENENEIINKKLIVQ
jgi:hypothetical protein